MSRSSGTSVDEAFIAAALVVVMWTVALLVIGFALRVADLAELVGAIGVADRIDAWCLRLAARVGLLPPPVDGE